MLTQMQSVFDKCPLNDQEATKTFNEKGKVIIKDRDGKF
jgi:hypothetical protein